MSGSANLAHGTWEQAEAMVGEVLAVTTGVDVVTAADIRRKLVALGGDGPRHTDADVARAHGRATIVAPASMLRVWAMPAYWAPGSPPPGAAPFTPPIPASRVPGEGDGFIATGNRVVHHADVHPGDRITSTAVLRSVTRKRTRIGDGAFLEVEMTYTNQHGGVVAVETTTLFRYREAGAEDAA